MQHPAGHEPMAGMSMSIPVTIPKGALYTEADVRFMQGMIAHHAQAIYMSRMAAAHGANPRLLKLATKIDQSQIAEIRLMQDWLRANGQVAPDTSSWRTMSMPGMLTAEQLAQLEKVVAFAKGKGLCGFIHMPGPPILSAVRHFPQDFQSHIQDKRCPARTA
jgi:hypothetical protein